MHRNPKSTLATHDVTNQPPPLVGVNLFETDEALKSAVAKAGGGAHAARLSAFGAACGSEETIEAAALANRFTPQLKSFDRYGRRLDEVEFHPAYHQLMQLGLAAGVSGAGWRDGEKAGHVLHSALLFVMGEAEGGVCCPMSMTFACMPALARDPAIANFWGSRITSCSYDSRFIPATEKKAVTIGMAMTEKQGGSDVRANATVAQKSADGWILTGHKWFCSAPMCDAFLTLAQTDAGLSCFLVPRWRPDGDRNAIHIMRLKDKLGDRSNASSEIEYHGAYAQLIGEEGRGVKTIIDMVQLTRLDCIVGSASGMRAAFIQALWHAAHRTAFQKKLIEQPAMTRVLADLAIESEAATALAFRVARAFDAAPENELEAAFARLATPLAKFWICKRQPAFVAEAMECLGGAGFVEESPMPRYFRHSPLNAIWEGSGNVIALDVLRALSREPASVEALISVLGAPRGADPRYDAHLRKLERFFAPGALHEGAARAFAETAGLALQAAALHDYAPDFIFEAFCATRLDGDARAAAFGASAATVNETGLLARTRLG